MKRLIIHPILNLQPGNAVEVFNVASNNNKVFFESGSSNEHIHVANFLATLLQKVANSTIHLKILNWILLEKIHNFNHILEMFFSFRLISTKIQLGKCNIRNLTLVNTNLSDMLYISAPCRNSSAISIGLLSPPQSLWKRARAASSLASDSSFQEEGLFKNSLRPFSASASSRSTCFLICSMSQWRSWRLRLLSIVSTASIGIVPTIVFISNVFCCKFTKKNRITK